MSNSTVITKYLDKYKGEIEAALPSTTTAKRMARLVLTEVSKTPALGTCNPKSLFGAVIQLCQLGLEPGNTLGQAYLIPFYAGSNKPKNVQMIIGYRGMLALARRSGTIASIQARAVYKKDHFDYCFGLDDTLTHKPANTARGELTHVYAIAKFVDGGLQWDVMAIDDVLKIRDQAEGYKSFLKGFAKTSPWETHLEEMAKKTIIRRLFKYLPMSTEATLAVSLDELGDAGVSQQNEALIDADFEVIEEPSLPTKSATEIVKASVHTISTFEDMMGKATTLEELELVVDDARFVLPDEKDQKVLSLFFEKNQKRLNK